MKSKKPTIPTIEELTEELRAFRINFAPLSNRFVGKRIVEIEHCLIELLGEIVEDARHYRGIRNSLFKQMEDAVSRPDFTSAHGDFNIEHKAMLERYAYTGIVGRFMRDLLERLNQAESKQIDAKREPTVTHARILAALIVGETERIVNGLLDESTKVLDLMQKMP